MTDGAGRAGARSGRRTTKRRRALRVAGERLPACELLIVDLHVMRSHTRSDVVVPAHVVHGKRPGPVLLVCAAIHGDEINGVEVVRRLLKLRLLRGLRGSLIGVPVVNVHGFMARERFLPDRRDLDRCFPGKSKGSLGSRLARHFTRRVVARATHAIDLHTGSSHRAELPHVHADLGDPEVERLARAFAAPVLVNARGWPEGSFAEEAAARGLPVLFFAGGEALRFDEVTIRTALGGVLGVLRALDMLKPTRSRGPARAEPFLAEATRWVRAPDSGVLSDEVPLGARVAAGQSLGVISDPVGSSRVEVTAPKDGVVISRLQIPLVNEGDALFHLGMGDAPPDLVESVERWSGEDEEGFQPFPERPFPDEPGEEGSRS